MQRILHVDYSVPNHIKLSDDCKALLKSILVAGVCECMWVGVGGFTRVRAYACNCIIV